MCTVYKPELHAAQVYIWPKLEQCMYHLFQAMLSMMW